jgi:hypothetical protein
MKRIIYLLALSLFVSGASFAQTDSTDVRTDSTNVQVEESEIERLEISHSEGKVSVKVETIDSITGEVKDTTKIKMKNSTIYIVNEENEFGDGDDEDDSDWNQKHNLTNWLGIDLGVNGFLTPNDDIDFDETNEFLEPELGASRSFAINFWEEKIRIAGDYVGILTGAGIEWNNYNLRNDYTLFSEKDTVFGVMGAAQDSSISFGKNKLRTTWLNVPLMLEFNTSQERSRSLHIAAGVIGGLRLGTMTKQRYKFDGERYQIRTRNDFEVNPYRIQAAARVGFGSVNLFATYQLTELFREGNGPELYPFTVGITLVAFD